MSADDKFEPVSEDVLEVWLESGGNCEKAARELLKTRPVVGEAAEMVDAWDDDRVMRPEEMAFIDALDAYDAAKKGPEVETTYTELQLLRAEHRAVGEARRGQMLTIVGGAAVHNAHDAVETAYPTGKVEPDADPHELARELFEEWDPEELTVRGLLEQAIREDRERVQRYENSAKRGE